MWIRTAASPLGIWNISACFPLLQSGGKDGACSTESLLSSKEIMHAKHVARKLGERLWAEATSSPHAPHGTRFHTCPPSLHLPSSLHSVQETSLQCMRPAAISARIPLPSHGLSAFPTLPNTVILFLWFCRNWTVPRACDPVTAGSRQQDSPLDATAFWLGNNSFYRLSRVPIWPTIKLGRPQSVFHYLMCWGESIFHFKSLFLRIIHFSYWFLHALFLQC